MAERKGFEPPVRLHAQLISSQPHSTTLPSLQQENTLNNQKKQDINILSHISLLD